MFYTIYKITNKLNGKIYIGKHQTNDLNDGYMGSGKHLKRSIEKYGIGNFKKEVLFQFNNELDMNAKEAELVTEEFVKQDTNYNLCPGGNGGFGYINLSGKNLYGMNGKTPNTKNNLSRGLETQKFLRENDLGWVVQTNKKISDGVKKHIAKNASPWKGRQHSVDTKEKIGNANSKSQSGSKNSQFGTMWITNGQENKKIKKDIDFIPEGWYKGRK